MSEGRHRAPDNTADTITTVGELPYGPVAVEDLVRDLVTGDGVGYLDAHVQTYGHRSDERGPTDKARLEAWLQGSERRPDGSVDVFFDWVDENATVSGNNTGYFNTAVQSLTGADISGGRRPAERFVIDGRPGKSHGRIAPEELQDDITLHMGSPDVESFVVYDGAQTTHYSRNKKNPNVWVSYTDGRRGHGPAELSVGIVRLMPEPSAEDVRMAGGRVALRPQPQY